MMEYAVATIFSLAACVCVEHALRMIVRRAIVQQREADRAMARIAHQSDREYV